MNLTTKKKIDLYLGGIFILFSKPLVMAVGKLLKRNHRLTPHQDLLIIKMLGGGSLVIALPALLGIKKQYPAVKLKLVTTPSVVPFAKSIGVFDEIVIIDDQSVFRLMTSTLLSIKKIIFTDTVVDLEVYSFLSAVLSLFTLARNRIGFYLESTFWKKGLFTHLIFFNRFSGSFYFYEEIALRLGATPATHAECKRQLQTVNQIQSLPSTPANHYRRIAIGHGCSENGSERMLTAFQWVQTIQTKATPDTEIHFLGSKADAPLAEQIMTGLRIEGHAENKLQNECGKHSLQSSLQILAGCDLFMGVDSGLLHFARALSIPSVSFFGPTDPSTRLKSDPSILEEIHYQKIPCSPCIHVAETPPCKGDNLCIKNLFDDSRGKSNKFHSFLVDE